MFFAPMVEAIQEALDNEESAVEPCRGARAEGIKRMAEYADISNAQAAKRIGVSPPYILRIYTEPLALTNYMDELTDFLQIPRKSIASPDEVVSFQDKNGVYAATIDALLIFRPETGQGRHEMPTEYVIRRCEEYFQQSVALGERLQEYFRDPWGNEEPDDDEVCRLEKALRLPVGAISDPDELRARQSAARTMSQETRQIIAANLQAIMERRGLEIRDVAELCGLSEFAVKRLLGERHIASLSLVFALATGLAIEPGDLMATNLDDEGGQDEAPRNSFFEGLPRAARELICRYSELVREKGPDDFPSARSRAVLLATPLIGYALEYLAESSDWSSDEPLDFVTMLGKIETLLRAGRAPRSLPEESKV